jgi:hypothetical protein
MNVASYGSKAAGGSPCGGSGGQVLSAMKAMSLQMVEQAYDAGQKMAEQIEGVYRAYGAMAGMGQAAARVLNYAGCCPPEDVCPPRCLLTLCRDAYPGEVIVVPFVIHNASSFAKTYQVGVHPLLDEEGNAAPASATLDQTSVTVAPFQSRLVQMRINLNGFKAGSVYHTDVVIRERDHNQDICFTLNVKSFADAPVATPLDERKMNRHFVGWQAHFYCDESRDVRQPPPREPNGPAGPG